MSIALTTDTVPKPPSPKFNLRFLLPFTGLFAVLIEVVFFSTRATGFLTGPNLLNILVQGAVVCVGAFGMAVVIIGGGDDVVTGGIDLSIGATMGLAGTVAATVLTNGQSIFLALFLAMVVSLLVGAANAGAISLGIRPLLATLALMGIAGSADLLISNNLQIPVTNGVFVWLRDGKPLGIPAAVLVLVVLFLLTWTVVSYTSVGVRLYATGGNPIAARVAGINTRKYVVYTYLFSGFCAAIAGMLLTARSSGSTPGGGSPLLLDIILAAFISVIFSRRLLVNILGTFVGGMFVAALTNGFTLINVPTYWVSGVKGVLILLVVAVSALQNKRGNA
jgi:ribose transport system permease protein